VDQDLQLLQVAVVAAILVPQPVTAIVDQGLQQHQVVVISDFFGYRQKKKSKRQNNPFLD